MFFLIFFEIYFISKKATQLINFSSTAFLNLQSFYNSSRLCWYLETDLVNSCSCIKNHLQFIKQILEKCIKKVEKMQRYIHTIFPLNIYMKKIKYNRKSCCKINVLFRDYKSLLIFKVSIAIN